MSNKQRDFFFRNFPQSHFCIKGCMLITTSLREDNTEDPFKRQIQKIRSLQYVVGGEFNQNQTYNIISENGQLPKSISKYK